MGSVYLRGKTYWLKYYRNGKPIRESSGNRKKSVAVALLREREGRIAQGLPLSMKVEKVLFDELAEDYLNDYRINAKRSLDRAERSVRRLSKSFSGRRAVSITTADVQGYTAKCQAEITRLGKPTSNATINRDLTALKRMFNMAKNSTPPKVHQVPFIPMLRENNVRKEFFEHDEYQAIRAAAVDYLKPIIATGYNTGMRKSEILSLKWPQVNLRERTITLDPGTTKNDERRVIYMADELYDTLAELKVMQEYGWPHVDHVFVRDGRPVRSIQRSWGAACKAVGLEGRWFHDLRRSAVSNMVRAGIPERVAMRISGHKTASIFARYNITSEDDLQRAAQSLSKYHSSMGTNMGTIEVAERIVQEADSGK